MIKIHSTKKLSTKLPVDKQGFLPSKEITGLTPSAPQNKTSPLSDWHANLSTVQRRNCILFVHDKTRFPLLLTCLTKKNYANLDYWFADELMNTLLKSGATQSQLDAAANSFSPLCIDNNCDRSVLGTMNQMKQDFESLLIYDNVKVEDISSYRTAAWLADRPCTVKGQKECIWPGEAMFELLDVISERK